MDQVPTDATDAELLEGFARHESEPAFAALVDRYIALVYSVSRRHASNPEHAQDITQAVFIILARKAAALDRKTVLAGWFYHTARLTALNWRRAEARRIRREQEAYMQSTLEEPAPDPLWHELAPLLDDAMAHLGASDRDALVLRYFQNRSLAEVGVALGIEERAAQKRVGRALEKLRKRFAQRGVTLTVSAIAGTVSANSVPAAPVGLAKTISAVAAAKGAAAGGSTLTLVKGALKMMAWAKAKTAMAVTAGALLAAGTATVTVKQLMPVPIDDRWFLTETGNLEKIPDNLTVFRPSHWADGSHGCRVVEVPSRMAAYNMRLDGCFVWAEYFSDTSRMVLPTNFPQGSFDVLLTRPHGRDDQGQEKIRQVFRDEIKKQFGYSARRETREVEALVLRVKNADAPALRHLADTDDSTAIQASVEGLNSKNFPLHFMAQALEPFLGIPVIDQTGLTNRVVLNLQWKKNEGETQKDTVMRVVSSELGLEFVPTNAPIEMLVVEKVK